ncbi:MAG TPA: AbrB/MazE/SpoVT family DNA-binding domain-containing protein [Candidatus Nanoarchaeia archaeon]|nr:AbrB/MazE/SpoVT family DNA-binding domain-containing protein [Candidatus Nanoarchaeia archaeon]
MVNKMEKTTLEKQGRIFIPKRLRHRLGLRTGQELMLQVTKDGILLKPSLSTNDFSTAIKGCIKDGKTDFLTLKKIWRM